jgi:hypothetical protein
MSARRCVQEWRGGDTHSRRPWPELRWKLQSPRCVYAAAGVAVSDRGAALRRAAANRVASIDDRQKKHRLYSNAASVLARQVC